jgi:hypothetical protein
VVEHDQRTCHRIEAGVEDEDVGLGLGQVLQQGRGVAGGAHDEDAQVVEEPAESLREQLVLVGYDDSHASVYLPDQLQGSKMVAVRPRGAW